jgi:hypothetical protein
LYNLAKRAGKRRKSVGLEVKLPANVMRTLDGDLKQRKSIAAIVEILNKKEYIRSVGRYFI